MYCTKCGDPITPVVALDIDGTLGDYHSHFIRFAAQYVGRSLPRAWDYTGEYGFREWFNDACGVGTEEYRAIKLAYRQGGMKRSMPLFPGADTLAWAVRTIGAELWMTTTRPYLSLDNIVPDTVEWLNRHRIQYDGMLFDEEKYKKLAERVDSERVVFILDDLIEMCEAANDLFPGSAVQALTTYNQKDRWSSRMKLDTAKDVMVTRIIKWKEAHA